MQASVIQTQISSPPPPPQKKKQTLMSVHHHFRQSDESNSPSSLHFELKQERSLF